MSYTVLARKYRPQTFADLVGQEHVTRTLTNAIASGRVAHAFLFTGVRGVGKTTSARILAKALNCERGPTAEPCNACDPCVQITAGVDLDVIEMDGASNNSVEDVRRLQESIPFRPARDRFKVVIVDEVHMLSTGAFNAFLKTLEEPPAHVKFIFATTEAHKVPVTIRSRCQRYDFRLIPQSVIAARVSEILAKENIEADEPAVTLVAREAAGSMRDALTLLDQVLAFSSEKLLGSKVAEELGIADREHVHALSEAVLRGDGKAALEVIDDLARQGLDLLHFAKQWLDLTRDMVVLRVAGDHPKLVDLPPEERARALASGARAEVLELERAFAAVAELVEEIGRSSAPKTTLEMGAVRIATRPPLRDLAQLIARLDELEKGGGGSGALPNAPRGGPARPGPGALGGGQRSAPHPPSAPAGAGTTPSAGHDKASQFQRFIPDHDADNTPPRAFAAPSTAPRSPVQAPVLSQAPATAAAAPALAVARPAAAPQLVAVPGGQAARPSHTGSDVDQRRWVALVQYLRDHEPRWAAIYEHGVPNLLSPERLVVMFPEGSFFGRQAHTDDGSEALRRAARSVLKADPQVEIRLSAEVTGTSLAQREAAQVDERKEAIKKKALNHPRVLEALKVFPELAQRHEVSVD